jgi:hypothetical protein
MINLQDHELMLRCQCFSYEHMAFLTHEPLEGRGNNLKGEHDDWYLSVRLNPVPFRKRLWRGLKFAFRPHAVRYGMYAELVLTTKDMEAIVEFINRRKGTV